METNKWKHFSERIDATFRASAFRLNDHRLIPFPGSVYAWKPSLRLLVNRCPGSHTGAYFTKVFFIVIQIRRIFLL